MSYQLLSISGHDRPGIVRDVADSIRHIDANIEDSSMTALRGRFTMMLIVKLPEHENLGALKAALAELEQRTGLTVQSQPLSNEEATLMPGDPDHVITVSGGDQVGIVYGVTRALADHGVSIVDVSTRARGDAYMMALEVVAGDAADAMRKALNKAAAELNVDIEVHELDGGIL